jgi:hypothetical protein
MSKYHLSVREAQSFIINDLQVYKGSPKEERCVGGNANGDVTPYH